MGCISAQSIWGAVWDLRRPLGKEKMWDGPLCWGLSVRFGHLNNITFSPLNHPEVYATCGRLGVRQHPGPGHQRQALPNSRMHIKFLLPPQGSSHSWGIRAEGRAGEPRATAQMARGQGETG